MPMNIVSGGSGNSNLSTGSSRPGYVPSQNVEQPSSSSYTPEISQAPDLSQLEYIPPSLDDIANQICDMITSYLNNKIQTGGFTLLQLSAMGSKRLIVDGQVSLSYLGTNIYSVLNSDIYDIGLLPGLDIMFISQDVYDMFVQNFPDFQDDQILIQIYNKLTSIASAIPVSSSPFEQPDVDDIYPGGPGGYYPSVPDQYYDGGHYTNESNIPILPVSQPSLLSSNAILIGLGGLALLLLLKK